MSEKKKWYNYFIIAEEDRTPAPEPPAKAGLAPSARPAPPARPTVAEAAGRLPAVEFKAPLKAESAEGVSFQTIYETAGIVASKHGFTILKVSEMFQSGHLKDLSAEIKKNAILVALEAAGVKIEEVVQDAVQRDRALDGYERVEERALRQLEEQKAAESAAVQKEIEAFLQKKQAQLQANNQAVEQAKHRFATWQARKQAEEQRIFETVSYFVAENPITPAPRPTPPGPVPAAPAPKTEK